MRILPLCCRSLYRPGYRGSFHSQDSVATASLAVSRGLIFYLSIYINAAGNYSTYDHTYWKARDPVRSPLVKPVRAGLVVGSVTTSEYPVLYVFFCPSTYPTLFFEGRFPTSAATPTV